MTKQEMLKALDEIREHLQNHNWEVALTNLYAVVSHLIVKLPEQESE